MRQVVLGVDDHVVLDVRQALLDFPVRDLDLLADGDAPQLLQRHVLAHLASEVLVADAFGRQHLRQVGERRIGIHALRDVGQELIQHTVGNLEPDAFRALQLELGKDHAFEHLLAQYVVGRQLEVVLARLRADAIQRLVEAAFQYHALVHDRGDAVDEFARFRELLGNRERRGSQCREGEQLSDF